MTPREFYEFLAKRETTGVIGFGEAAVSLRVGPQDAMAALEATLAAEESARTGQVVRIG